MPTSYPNSDDLLRFEETSLQYLKIAASRAISPEFAERMRFSEYREIELNRLIWSLSGYVLAEKLAEQRFPVRFEEEVYFESPSGWWQHLKSDWNEWLIRKTKGHYKLWRVCWHLTGNVKTTWTTKKVWAIKEVKTQQFATFPASPIQTPEKIRGPIVVRYETTEVYK